MEQADKLESKGWGILPDRRPLLASPYPSYMTQEHSITCSMLQGVWPRTRGQWAHVQRVSDTH